MDQESQFVEWMWADYQAWLDETGQSPSESLHQAFVSGWGKGAYRMNAMTIMRIKHATGEKVAPHD